MGWELGQDEFDLVGLEWLKLSVEVSISTGSSTAASISTDQAIASYGISQYWVNTGVCQILVVTDEQKCMKSGTLIFTITSTSTRPALTRNSKLAIAFIILSNKAFVDN